MAMDTNINGLSGTKAEVAATNELQVLQLNKVSTLNSTSTALAGAAVFTGTAEDVSQYAEIRVACYSDQASAASGLSIQQSMDGSNWDILDVYTVPATTAKPITLGVAARYLRIVYTNGATLQGVFRLQCVFHKNSGRGSSQVPADARAQMIDCDEHLAYGMAYDGTVFNLMRLAVKATQGAYGLCTQDLKDSGRSQRVIFLDSFQVAATAETIMTCSYSTDNAAVTTGTSYNVTAGKRLRIQGISAVVHSITGNTTSVTPIVRIRVNNSGAGIVSSPIQHIIPLPGVTGANQAGVPINIDFPDGWEHVASAGIAVTIACPGYVVTTAAPQVSLVIRGYEY